MDSNRTATAALRVVNSLVREANAELSVNLVCDYNHEHMKLGEVKRGHIWEVLEATKRSITSERQERKFIEQGRVDLGRVKVEGGKHAGARIELFSKEMK